MFKTLIVEDNPAFRQSLCAMLCGQFPFMEVAEAGNGEDALRQIETRAPDLVFVDIKLPGKNGLDLTGSIKSGHAGIVIVILTGHDLPEYREAAFASGADHFLSKASATEADILALVRRVLSDRPTAH